MPKSSAAIEPVNNFYSGGSRRAAQLAQAVPARTPLKLISAAKPKPAKLLPLGPTPERMAKGDIPHRTPGGFHRAVPPIERMRDRGQLDHMPHLNQALFEAAEKLRRHYESSMIGVQAQDIENAVTRGPSDDLVGEEAWVHHFDTFRMACKVMGWSEVNPHRGAGRIVVAVVCHEMPVKEAAMAHIGAGRTEAVLAAGMDRLREGLFGLAQAWNLC